MYFTRSGLYIVVGFIFIERAVHELTAIMYIIYIIYTKKPKIKYKLYGYKPEDTYTLPGAGRFLRLQKTLAA